VARHRIAYVPQRSSVDWDFPTSVMDVVLMGMNRQLGLLGRIRGRHRQTAMECLARVGMERFMDRQIGQLSGGQQQRVFLAGPWRRKPISIFSTNPSPASTPPPKKAIIEVLKHLRDAGRTVVAVHHDLSTVRAYFDRVALLNVRKIAEGTVDTAFTAEALQAAYGGRLATAQIDQLQLSSA
jgi:manganese/zinc/iron transport system ATP- binding protein